MYFSVPNSSKEVMVSARLSPKSKPASESSGKNGVAKSKKLFTQRSRKPSSKSTRVLTGENESVKIQLDSCMSAIGDVLKVYDDLCRSGKTVSNFSAKNKNRLFDRLDKVIGIIRGVKKEINRRRSTTSKKESKPVKIEKTVQNVSWVTANGLHVNRPIRDTVESRLAKLDEMRKERQKSKDAKLHVSKYDKSNFILFKYPKRGPSGVAEYVIDKVPAAYDAIRDKLKFLLKTYPTTSGFNIRYGPAGLCVDGKVMSKDIKYLLSEFSQHHMVELQGKLAGGSNRKQMREAKKAKEAEDLDKQIDMEAKSFLAKCFKEKKNDAQEVKSQTSIVSKSSRGVRRFFGKRGTCLWANDAVWSWVRDQYYIWACLLEWATKSSSFEDCKQKILIYLGFDEHLQSIGKHPEGSSLGKLSKDLSFLKSNDFRKTAHLEFTANDGIMTKQVCFWCLAMILTDSNSPYKLIDESRIKDGYADFFGTGSRVDVVKLEDTFKNLVKKYVTPLGKPRNTEATLVEFTVPKRNKFLELLDSDSEEADGVESSGAAVLSKGESGSSEPAQQGVHIERPQEQQGAVPSEANNVNPVANNPQADQQAHTGRLETAMTVAAKAYPSLDGRVFENDFVRVKIISVDLTNNRECKLFRTISKGTNWYNDDMFYEFDYEVLNKDVLIDGKVKYELKEHKFIGLNRSHLFKVLCSNVGKDRKGIAIALSSQQITPYTMPTIYRSNVNSFETVECLMAIKDGCVINMPDSSVVEELDCQFMGEGSEAEIVFFDNFDDSRCHSDIILINSDLPPCNFKHDRRNLTLATTKRMKNKFNYSKYERVRGELHQRVAQRYASLRGKLVDVDFFNFVEYVEELKTRKKLTVGQYNEWLANAFFCRNLLRNYGENYLLNYVFDELEHKTRVFIKMEIYDKMETTPRFIFSPSIVVKIVLGCFFEKVENIVFYDRASPLYGHCIKGKCALEVHNMLQELQRAEAPFGYVETDYSAFESSQCPESMSLLFTAYISMFEEPVLVGDTILWSGSSYPIALLHMYYGHLTHSVWVYNKRFKVKRPPMKESGLTDTSLGNAIMNDINAILLLDLCNNHLIEGDDLIGAAKRRIDQAYLDENSLFPTTLLVKENVFELSFCGYRFDSEGNRYMTDQEKIYQFHKFNTVLSYQPIGIRKKFELGYLRLLALQLRYPGEPCVISWVNQFNYVYDNMPYGIRRKTIEQWERENWWRNERDQVRLFEIPHDITKVPILCTDKGLCDNVSDDPSHYVENTACIEHTCRQANPRETKRSIVKDIIKRVGYTLAPFITAALIAKFKKCRVLSLAISLSGLAATFWRLRKPIQAFRQLRDPNHKCSRVDDMAYYFTDPPTYGSNTWVYNYFLNNPHLQHLALAIGNCLDGPKQMLNFFSRSSLRISPPL